MLRHKPKVTQLENIDDSWIWDPNLSTILIVFYMIAHVSLMPIFGNEWNYGCSFTNEESKAQRG